MTKSVGGTLPKPSHQLSNWWKYFDLWNMWFDGKRLSRSGSTHEVDTQGFVLKTFSLIKALITSSQ